MNITRVERDGVEFFTIDETGESGMSESGLARLCGVAASSVHRFVSNSAVRWDHEKTLDPRFRKTISFCAGNEKISSFHPKSNLKILSATVCARTIEHFTFDARSKTEEALFAYRKFAVKGINAWIQDATAYRVYLILQKAVRMRVQLSAPEIMEQAKISRSGYSTAVGKLADADLLPEWCSIKRKRHPERDVRDRLQAELGGQVEAYTRYGLIDLLTATELIEIKTVDRWKDAVGHILAKAHRYPNHAKRLHLFSSEEPILETIEQVCTPHDIRVTYEKVDRPKLNPSPAKST
jgi:hypothetical protein